MSINNLSNESPLEKLRTTELQWIRRIIMELEPMADIYERRGIELFKMYFELLAEHRALEKGLVDNPQRELKLSDVYRRTFTSTCVDDRNALLKVVPDKDP